MGTTEHGKMLKRIQILEDGWVPSKETQDWKIEGKKRRTARKEHRRLSKGFEMEGQWHRRVMESSKRKNCKTEVRCRGKKVMSGRGRIW